MKKILPAILVICAAFTSHLYAQNCGNSGPSACVTTGTLTTQGFENMDSIPCIVKDSAYNQTVQFLMYSSFYFLGDNQAVDSIQFVSITNLPCGICWASSTTNNLFRAGESGCLKFTGTTADSAGQYKLALGLNASVNGQPAEYIPPSLVAQTGIAIYLRVMDGTVSCVPVDTSSSYPNLTATTGCPTAITNVPMDISAMSIVPNPMNSSSILSFTSETSTSYLLHISNIAGQELSVKEVKAVSGLNQVSIERNNLAQGIYLVTLSNGQSSLTKKLIILD